MRIAQIIRNTNETKISLSLNIDGTGKSKIVSGSGFLDHMLTLFSRHADFDIELKCVGDTEVDYHHTAEDIGISLGKALFQAMGDKKGINRYGDITLPMDEALVLTALDISGRCYCNAELDFPTEKIGDFDTELVKEFLIAFSREAQITLHVIQFAGENSHHIAEAVFKSLARALKMALEYDSKHLNDVPSTKGVL